MLSVLTKSEKEEQSAAAATATDTDADGEANQCAKGVKLCMLLALLTVSCGLLLLLIVCCNVLTCSLQACHLICVWQALSMNSLLSVDMDVYVCGRLAMYV